MIVCPSDFFCSSYRKKTAFTSIPIFSLLFFLHFLLVGFFCNATVSFFMSFDLHKCYCEKISCMLSHMLSHMSRMIYRHMTIRLPIERIKTVRKLHFRTYIKKNEEKPLIMLIQWKIKYAVSSPTSYNLKSGILNNT